MSFDKAKLKKRTKRFKRHQSDLFKRVKPSWRKPHGIDSCVRRRFRDTLRMPKIGYGNNKKFRHVLPNGKKKFLVRNISEIDVLLMHKNEYCAELARTLSSRTRRAILLKADELGVKVTNPHAKVVAEEVE